MIVLARKELHRLLEGKECIIVIMTCTDRELASTPLLVQHLMKLLTNCEGSQVVANKIDLHPHLTEPELIRELNLDYVTDNPWIVIPVSALKVINIDQIVSWLIKQSAAVKHKT